MRNRSALVLCLFLAIVVLSGCPPVIDPGDGDDEGTDDQVEVPDDPPDNPGDQPLFSAPTAVAATQGIYSDQVLIAWNPVAGAQHYVIYRAGDELSTPVAIGYVEATYTGTYNTTSSPAEAPIAPGEHYFYRVAAADAALATGELSEAAEGWAFLSAVPEDFEAVYLWTSGTGIDRWSYTVFVGDAPSLTIRRWVDGSLQPDEVYAFEVGDLDLEAFYEVVLEHDMYRETWPEPSRTPLGGSSDTLSFEDSGSEYSVPAYLALSEDIADKEAVADAIKALLPPELAELL